MESSTPAFMQRKGIVDSQVAGRLQRPKERRRTRVFGETVSECTRFRPKAGRCRKIRAPKEEIISSVEHKTELSFKLGEFGMGHGVSEGRRHRCRCLGGYRWVGRLGSVPTVWVVSMVPQNLRGWQRPCVRAQRGG